MKLSDTMPDIRNKVKLDQARTRVMSSKGGGYYYVPSKKYVEMKRRPFIPPTRSTNPQIVNKLVRREFLAELHKSTHWKAISNWQISI